MLHVFEPEREEIGGGFKNVHNEELHNLYSSPDITRMIISRRIILYFSILLHWIMILFAWAVLTA
jgi:hypothetical protein